MEKEPAADGLYYRHPHKDRVALEGGLVGRLWPPLWDQKEWIAFKLLNDQLILCYVSNFRNAISLFEFGKKKKKRLIQESKLSNWKTLKWSATHCLMLSLFFNLMESKTFLEVDGLEGNILLEHAHYEFDHHWLWKKF